MRLCPRLTSLFLGFNLLISRVKSPTTQYIPSLSYPLWGPLHTYPPYAYTRHSHSLHGGCCRQGFPGTSGNETLNLCFSTVEAAGRSRAASACSVAMARTPGPPVPVGQPTQLPQQHRTPSALYIGASAWLRGRARGNVDRLIG